MRDVTRPLVILIAGPAGTGKTTLSEIIRQHYSYDHISEDELAKELFPDTCTNIEDHPDKLKTVERLLLKNIRAEFDSGNCVVVDWINLEPESIEEIRQLFHEDLILKVLWPPIETTIERDLKRECWTSGEISIRRSYEKYEKLKSTIGEANYIDNSLQTPGETLELLIAAIEHAKDREH